MSKNSLLSRFNEYQKERFPFAVLIFTTGIIILSSYAVINQEFHLFTFFLTLFFSLSFLFHIRVKDEERDFFDDSKYHKQRPIQKGIINLSELKCIDYSLLVISIILLIIGFKKALPIFLIGLVFIFFSSKDFFIRKKIINKPILYHLLNSIQMIILIFFIYLIINPNFKLNNLIIIHIIFVQLCIFLIEVVRKIKPSENQENLNDSYLSKLGIKKLKYLLLILFLSMFLTFIIIITTIKSNLLIISISLISLFICMYWLFGNINKIKIQNMLLSCSLIYYLLLNLLIFISGGLI